MERTIHKRLIEEVQRLAIAPLDLEEDLFEPEEVSAYETVDPETIEALTNFSSAENVIENQEFTQIIQDLLDSVTPREAKVLKLRFGIGVAREHTLEEIASIFDVCRERVRQIEGKVLRKMRHPSRSDKIKPYIEECKPPSVFKEPFPDIDHYWGVDGLARYYDAIAMWHTKKEAAEMKLEEIRAQLKKGTLI